MSAFPHPVQLSFAHAGWTASLWIALGFAFCGPAVNSQAPATPAEQRPPASQAIAPVMTTVVVHGEIKDDYLPETLSAGTLDTLPLSEAPVAATVVTRDLLTDTMARTLSDVVKNDASIGEDYAPVGYYGDYEIRGFPIDLATGIEINGLTVAGEQDVPLENKERVELLKGVAGVESGVASAGGMINYVTRRPVPIKAIDTATDHRGGAFGDLDLGHLFGARKQTGVRVNAAGESLRSYVNGADGWRGMGAAAADWQMTAAAILKTDFEYQHKVERSVSGYQLLGGTTLPDLHRITPSTMLGAQPWSKPNTFDTYNTGVRLDYDLPHGWRAFGAAAFSHSLIDDNVIYAYGCGYEADCTSSGGTSPDYFFAPDGGYDIYDYRNPGELRINGDAEGMAFGHVRTGSIVHDVAAGGELFRRSVQQPGYFTADNPTSPDGVVQDGAVYTYIGSENIYQPIAQFPGSVDDFGTRQQAGPRRLWEDNHQSSVIVQDRMHLPGRVKLSAGARYDALRDDNYSLTASSPSTAPALTKKGVWLPQFAASYNPMDNLTLYVSYGVMQSLGPQAPWWAGSYFLAPYLSRQVEAGAKYEPSGRILLSTALYRMRAPFFYPKGSDNGDDLVFVSEGHETHDGVELNAEGKAAEWLRVDGSASAIKAISSETGTPAFDNRQVLNVPHLRTSVFADVSLAHTRGLHVLPGWSYTGRKEATRDDAVSVPAYSLFNLGARYTFGGEQGHMALRVYADNITNKRYWKDTGASYGDTFVHLGAPTTVRLSAHYTF